MLFSICIVNIIDSSFKNVILLNYQLEQEIIVYFVGNLAFRISEKEGQLLISQFE